MKTEHIQKQLDFFVRDKAHHAYRKPAEDVHALAAEFAAQGLDDMQRSVARLRYVLAQETPVVFPDERITLLRTVRTIPEIHTEEEDKRLHETHAFHENGRVFNMCPDYGMLMAGGFTKKAEKIRAQLEQAKTAEQKEFLQAMLDVLSIVTDFAARYREEALRVGNLTVADTLSKIPANAPKTLLEALQFLRLLHYAMWCNGNYHNTIGRIDQFLYPYYRHDLDAGLLTKDEALEQLEEFFISCNRDSDLYIGIQQGDNGQTIVLGGSNEDGTDAYNELSELCLIASRDLCLIDPKVNLRVHKNTPLSVYELATTLTQKGLGFPQYTNDEIVIPALLHWGYEKKDAYNYTLAACWEILVTGYMDLVNWDSLNFLKTVQDACEHLPECKTYEDFAAFVKQNIEAQAEALMAETKNVYKEPSPLVSLMCPDCLEKMRDISKPGKYNNYGFHGDGLAPIPWPLSANMSTTKRPSRRIKCLPCCMPISRAMSGSRTCSAMKARSSATTTILSIPSLCSCSTGTPMRWKASRTTAADASVQVPPRLCITSGTRRMRLPLPMAAAHTRHCPATILLPSSPAAKVRSPSSNPLPSRT